jgi:DNA-binding transcriptional ArsR family regulator
MQWAFNQDIKPSSVKFVLVSLGDNAQTDGLAWPSIAALAQKTGQDRKTVMHALDRLEKTGYLTDTGERKGNTCQIKIYRFNFSRVKDAENGTVNDNSNHQEDETNDTENGTLTESKEYRNSLETVPNFPTKSTVFPHKSTENGTRNPKEPSNEPSGKPHKRAKAAPDDFDPMAALLAEGVDEETAGDFLRHRKKKRADVTRTVIKQHIKQAAIAGMTLTDALAMTCSRGWQGFDAAFVPNSQPASAGNQKLGKAGQATAQAAQRFLERKNGTD